MTKFLPFVNSKVGLVLVGGGAKGAYQVGALRYLAELGFKPHIIAGTSIGALNGAIVAAQPDLLSAAQQLEQLWQDLGSAKILRVHEKTVSRVAAYGVGLFTPEFRIWLDAFLKTAQLDGEHHALFDPEPIERFVREAIDIAALRQGLDLWETVFPSLKIPLLDYEFLLDLARAKLGTSAHWLLAQDCAQDDELLNLLLASAAIPLAFPQRQVNGQSYVDGALADNVPIKPLIDQGCTHIIVIHLQNGAVWDRNQFPDQTIIEIRPQQKINALDLPLIGRVNALLDFRAEPIAALKQMGYEDAQKTLEPILTTWQTARSQHQAQTQLIQSTQALLDEPLL